MIVVTKVEPEYALRNQLIGIRLNLQNRGIEEKRAEILVYISEKSQRVANNIFDKRDSLNTLTTEVISADKPASVYVPLKNGILVDRGVISYTIEIKQLQKKGDSPHTEKVDCDFRRPSGTAAISGGSISYTDLLQPDE